MGYRILITSYTEDYRSGLFLANFDVKKSFNPDDSDRAVLFVSSKNSVVEPSLYIVPVPTLAKPQILPSSSPYRVMLQSVQ